MGWTNENLTLTCLDDRLGSTVRKITLRHVKEWAEKYMHLFEGQFVFHHMSSEGAGGFERA
jgi:hypothetical protein